MESYSDTASTEEPWGMDRLVNKPGTVTMGYPEEMK